MHLYADDAIDDCVTDTHQHGTVRVTSNSYVTDTHQHGAVQVTQNYRRPCRFGLESLWLTCRKFVNAESQ